MALTCLPDWPVDWDALRRCPQDPVHHAEGDVFTHLGMVLTELEGLAGWRTLDEIRRRIVYHAVLLHDIAKPQCTRREDGRITSRGHAARGALDARRLLWEIGIPFEEREAVCGLVRHHMAPMHGLGDGAEETAIRASQTAQCDLLCVLAEADARGRICQDPRALLDNVALFREYCAELGCLERPFPFASGHSRFEYFRSEGRDPRYHAFDSTVTQVTMMAGLPGAGKDHWIRENRPDWPVVSLDRIREVRGIPHGGPQGEVAAEAREQARGYLRERRPFVWNACSLNRDLRRRTIDLFASYGARVEIVYVEAPKEVLYRQNRQRDKVVPEAGIAKMLNKWEIPDVTECHDLVMVVPPAA
ncbi:MAG: HD domain-containing protein [Acidobacteria bacterium]|nr:HD domain-containing protein [Acidobacteriota bacterium]